MREAQKRTFLCTKKWEHNRHTVITFWKCVWWIVITEYMRYSDSHLHPYTVHNLISIRIYSVFVWQGQIKPVAKCNFIKWFSPVEAERYTRRYGSNARISEWFAHLSSKRADDQPKKTPKYISKLRMHWTMHISFQFWIFHYICQQWFRCCYRRFINFTISVSRRNFHFNFQLNNFVNSVFILLLLLVLLLLSCSHSIRSIHSRDCCALLFCFCRGFRSIRRFHLIIS